MDYRQLPGDPRDAELFSWQDFLEDGRRTDASQLPAATEGADETGAAQASDARLRSAGAIVITGLALVLAPHVMPELSEDLRQHLSVALADLSWISPSDFLDLEIPIRDFAE